MMIRILMPMILVALALLVSCSGGTMVDTSQSFDEWEQNAIIESSSAPGVPGLPDIPMDLGEPDKSSSALGEIGATTVLGADYLQMAGGYVDGTALVLDPGDGGDPSTGGEGPLPGYGLYKVSGLLGKRPLSLNVECLPKAINQGYFVGLADYTNKQWHWFGPTNLPEFELDLRPLRNQYVTHVGNMYFLVVVPQGNAATHTQTTVVWGQPNPSDLPGSPHHLVASDGQFPEAIGVTWVGAAGAQAYQVFRKPLMPAGDWELVGQTENTNYMDAPMPDWKLFCYRVRAVSEGGPSEFSNKDTGFAGGGDDPVVIEGDVTLINGEPLKGIPVGLVGFGEEMVRFTNENGKFWFGNLPPGRYLVAPHHPELEFFPPYQLVDMRNQIHREIHFNAAPTALFHRVFGFTVTVVPDEAGMPRVVPLPGTLVRSNPIGDPDNALVGFSNSDGFYVINDLPEGINIVRAAKDGFNFVPQFHEVVVNGTNPPDRRDFLGMPEGDGTLPPD